MLTIHFANRTERLAALLAERVGAGAMFTPDEVIVPSAALRRHLTLALARRHGICANVRFGYLAQSLWQWIARVVPGVQAESPFAPGVLAWRILAAFDAPGWSDAHPRLRDYLAHSDAAMRYELARQVAGLFDQYITYRPDWLARWAAAQGSVLGAAAPASARADEAWQAALWRRLSETATKAGMADAAAGAAHPAETFASALASRGEALVAAGSVPAALHVFGLPSLPPLHLGLLQALGACVDVQLYVLNPCREYWLEIVDRRRLAWLAAPAAVAREGPPARSSTGSHASGAAAAATTRRRADSLHHEEGNRLLAAWGGQTKAQLELLIAATGEDATIDEAHFDEPEGDHLLARLQRSILDLTTLDPGSIALESDDRSIEVHVCHGLARELEVLHDRLLALFAGPHPPAPSDILVVTPDLEAAAPIIDTVFGTAPAQRRIPYHVTGRARSSVNPATRALLDLLALAASRFAVSEVFGLLQQPIVARRFGLDAEGLAQVHAWLRAAGVHWGLDAEHRAAFGLPPQERHSFADGLERLLLGYALPTCVDAPFDGRLPAGDAEGSDALALGALARCIAQLAALRRRTAAPQPAAAWRALLGELLHDFLAPAGEEAQDLAETLAGIERLEGELRRADPALLLPFDVLRVALAEALDDAARGGVPGGAVTFAAMSSLRNLPYAVVCAIGLNDGAFPSPPRPFELDLMARDPRPGDRQRRIDERNLFLDLLLAARRHFYLSYSGRSVRDNAPLPPSVLVSELLDTLLPAIAVEPRQAAGAARDRLVVLHPLQGFSEIGFRVDSDARLRSYDSETAGALQCRSASASAEPAPATRTGAPDAPTPPPDTQPAPPQGSDDDEAEDDDADDGPEGEALQPFFATPLAPPGDEWCDVALADLITFFRNPCRTLLQRRLSITLAKADDELQDDEPFIAGIPARSALAARLLPGLRAGQGVAAARTLALAGTDVPAGAFGRSFLDRELAGLERFAARLNALTAEPVRPAPHEASVTLAHEGRAWRVHAGFADLRASGLVRHRYDDVRARDVIDAWLHHLLLCADPAEGVAPRTTWLGRDARLVLEPVHAPRDVWQTLIELYARGLREPLYFFPKSAWAYMKDDRRSIAKATAAWQVSERHPFGESSDAAYRLALRALPDPMGDGWSRFEDCADAVFGPLLQVAREEPLS